MTLMYQDIIDAMTLEEKASLLSGANYWNTKSVDRLGVPSIIMTDGPHGLRRQAGKADHLGLNKSVPATCFPTAAALAQSWDEQLIEQVGEAIGAEAAGTDVSAVLGPGLNIVRDPLAGRAFEYYSEDPYVSGKLAAALVRGIQKNGVAATPKHFAVNSQEFMRMSIDEIVDERTMREIYLEGFRRVVQEAHPKFLMTSYNKINGTYANENRYLLEEILKGEWGYKGAIVSDWGGNHDRVSGLIAGSTLEMPTSNGVTDAQICQAVKNGTLDESIVNEQVDILLTLVYETKKAIKDAPSADYDAHHKLAIEAATRSMVLLKNEHSTLPLAKGAKIAIIGDFAQTPRYQGAGSSLVNPTRIIGAKEALFNDRAVEVIGYEPGFKRTGGKSSQLRRKAVALAQKAEVVLVFAGLDEAREAEGIDRPSMALPENQLSLLNELAKVHQKIVVVIAAGGAIDVSFADKVSAIIHGSLGGQALGLAIADCLTGRRNPSGKLAVSYPFNYNDAPTAPFFPGKEKTSEHREGLYVGYRYYETVQKSVRYPFGYGLSYTTFSYRDIEVSEEGVSFSVTNSGPVAGDEIAQVYVHSQSTESSIFRPTRELKGFARVSLQPGETKRVGVSFDDHTFAYYSAKMKSWRKIPGTYSIEVSASVQDIRLKAELSVTGEIVPNEYDPTRLPSYYTGSITSVSDEEFETLLGRPLPQKFWDRKANLTYDDTIAQLQYRGLRARAFYGLLRVIKRVLFILNKPNTANNVVFIMNLPFSKIPSFSGGKLSEKTIKRLLGDKS